MTEGLRVRGSWSTSKGRISVIAKFGFQQIDPLETDTKTSRGFIYGNVSSESSYRSRAVLFIVPQTLLSSFFLDSIYGQTCESMLQNVSLLAFETNCMPKGKGDIMRWVPCRKGSLCDDESDPTKVVSGYQMTLRVEEPYAPEYWYVLLIGCNLDANCSWVPSGERISVNYDVWLTNGSPLAQYLNPFTHQFSFEEQVVSGYQMTLRVEEPYAPEYWYVLLIGCNLDANCSWVPSGERISVNYDVWLTNGSPLAQYLNPFTHQFSFEEQDSAEMYLTFLLLYSILCLCQWRALALIHQPRILPRQKLLTCIIATKTAGLALQSLNVVVFAFDGQGVMVARLFGEMFRLWSVCVLCLLLILLSRGWSLNDVKSSSSDRIAVLVWAILTTTHFALFFINFFFIDDILHDIDLFKSWPGYGMLLIRIFQALWFLTEMRVSIDREQAEDKAEFLAHIGAGYLVWFVYPLGLGVIVSFISVLWRFKIILAITTVANFIAIACLVHLFWPTSVNRRYFLGDISFYRRMERADSTEMEDFERLLISDEVQSDSDFPPDETVNGT
ncbi:Transmembrane protein [Toxocara canis]|uniref:Transmembrane protein n=1 Tax=Toxocara canis TaxID=6265 RepID=A0A0B2VUN9_TOXCA|nr:Transmembrane protein [Toxocara canis]